jgi:pyruvate-formate lyase
MCLKASLELKLIDPKVNLRVNRDTPLAVYLLGTQLTKQGLGFPQYCNDDIVIPGLQAKGYDLIDARNYVVAANFSPGLNTRVNGPVSVIRSFTKPDLKRVINGGPLTLELHDTVFRNEEGIQKVALLVGPSCKWVAINYN